MGLDLIEFYFQNITKAEYHHRFYKAIEDINFVYNFFSGSEAEEDYVFYDYDAEEAITEFRKLCQPNVYFNIENTCWFYLITYYLFKNGYKIKEFLSIITRPPVDPTGFTYGDIRNRIIAQGDNDNGTIMYAIRRAFVASLTFEQKDD